MNCKHWICAVLCVGASHVAQATHSDQVRQAVQDDFTLIAKNLERYHPSSWSEFEKVERETFRKESLIAVSDQTPVDVILRRVSALIEKRDLGAERTQLAEFAKENRADLSLEEQRALFGRIATLRREVMFSDPLLDFDSLLFVKHDRMARGFVHMVDQYFGFNQTKQGGIYHLENPFSDAPTVCDVLDQKKVQNGPLKGRSLDFKSGSFLSLDLDYDANKILFAFSEVDQTDLNNSATWEDQAWAMDQAAEMPQRFATHYRWKPESSFHIFESDLNTGAIRQLTDGMWDDFDPCYLPSGRIVFISARCGGNQRCGWRFLPTYLLHTMMPDGSDPQPLSFHDTNEWNPSVDNNGMLIYTRWDYVDRDANVAHHLWSCFPDGRDPRSMHGNYPERLADRPNFEAHTRSIPNSGRYLSMASAHHGESYGPLILIDQSVRDDGAMSQVKRITPLAAFPEAESTAGNPAPHNRMFGRLGAAYQADWLYTTPWPLSTDLYLCSYDPFGSRKGNAERALKDNRYGLYLVDSFGNRELIYLDERISCRDPIPFRARTRPPQIPVQTQQMKADRVEPNFDPSMGTVALLNVYEAEKPIPEGVKITDLRIVGIFPKSQHDQISPRIGVGYQSLARGVLGTVPVEEDGSAHFECPTGMAIYFQALDENGMMVQNMRSDTYLHPGERLTCIGCHEDKHSAPQLRGNPLALQRAPSKIEREAMGSFPLTFPRLVQPVLDANCVSCHAEKAINKPLWGDQFTEYGWSHAMNTLSPLGWTKHGAAKGMFGLWLNKRSYSLPMQEGARVSKLYHILEQGHHGVELSPEEMRRITLWLDCNSVFYGAYKEIKKQARGKVVLPEVGLPHWTEDASKWVH